VFRIQIPHHSFTVRFHCVKKKPPMVWFADDFTQIMDVGGFSRDYSLLADLAGHEYFAIHRDAILPRTEWVRPDGWVLQETQGFHGPAIGVSGGSHLGIPAS
jgi:hypothetical protein